jgi:hypothetical protein
MSPKAKVNYNAAFQTMRELRDTLIHVNNASLNY